MIKVMTKNHDSKWVGQKVSFIGFCGYRSFVFVRTHNLFDGQFGREASSVFNLFGSYPFRSQD